MAIRGGMRARKSVVGVEEFLPRECEEGREGHWRSGSGPSWELHSCSSSYHSHAARCRNPHNVLAEKSSKAQGRGLAAPVVAVVVAVAAAVVAGRHERVAAVGSAVVESADP